MTEKAITLEEAVKSKDNFTKFIEENSEECIKQVLKGLPVRSLHIVIPQMTPTADGLCNGLGAFNDGQKCYVFWFINNEKEEILKLAESLNTRFSKICGIFIIKPFLNNNKTDFKCILKPEINKRPPVNINTQTKQLQKELWEKYIEICDTSDYPDLQIKEALPRHYQFIKVGKSGVQLLQTINTQKSYVASELLINNNKELYETLYSHKKEIEKQIGKLEWDCKESNKSAKIRQVYSIDIQNPDNYEQAINKQLEMGAELIKISHKYL